MVTISILHLVSLDCSFLQEYEEEGEYEEGMVSVDYQAK